MAKLSTKVGLGKGGGGGGRKKLGTALSAFKSTIKSPKSGIPTFPFFSHAYDKQVG
jgi:hypothetical protein